MAGQTYEQKKKKYINVFYGLIALTVIELVCVFLPIHHTPKAILIGLFSSAKAVVVGYYYMHLEFETKWLKVVACLPIIAFGYAYFLVIDAHDRPMSPYNTAPARVYNHGHGEAKHDAFGVEKAGEEAQAQLEAQLQVKDGAAGDAPAKAEGKGEAAKEESPKAAPETDEWR